MPKARHDGAHTITTMNSPQRWREIKDLFNMVLDTPPDQRVKLLDTSTAGDADLRREVESMLEAHASDATFLESSALELISGAGKLRDHPVNAGTMIGPYKVIRVIGSGGMGLVTEAVRSDEHFQKRVAIKQIKRGMDSDAILRRFRQERQILAALDHAGIARLLDGGVGDDGLPYLVMEYVDGVAITHYASREHLSPREIVELFRSVCVAVHFAHQNLVVHRDLKPSNILVTDAGEARLLDFGVAKLLKQNTDENSVVTEIGDRLLTPAYASPEQLRGEPATTASDVYSLGVILYELLSGKRPYELHGAAAESMAGRLGDMAILPPSAASRGSGQWSEELDNIVLMAMKPERDRRYLSAAALADDLERYLAGRPVQAQKDTGVYRVRKFMHRHKVAVAAAVVVTLALTGAASTTLWQAREAIAARAVAEARFNDVHALTKTLLFEVHDAIDDIPGTTNARELIVARAFEYLDRLAAEHPERELTREIIDAYLRLAAAQGSPAGANRGDLHAARSALDRAKALTHTLLDSDSSDATALRTSALVNEKLGDVIAWTGDVPAGVEHARQALEGFAALAARAPDSVRAQLSVVISTVKHSDLTGNSNFPNLGNTQGALDGYRSALTRLDAPPLAGSNDHAVTRYRGLVHERMGTQQRALRQWDLAAASYQRSLEIRQKLAAEPTGGTNARRDVAVTLQNLCEIQLELGETTTAASQCGRALAEYLVLQEVDTSNVQALEDLARINSSLARVEKALHRTAAATRAAEETVAIRERIWSTSPENTLNGRLLVVAFLELAAVSGRRVSQRAREVLQDLEASGLDMSSERVRLASLAGWEH